MEQPDKTDTTKRPHTIVKILIIMSSLHQRYIKAMDKERKKVLLGQSQDSDERILAVAHSH
jgi:hypothetical protein